MYHSMSFVWSSYFISLWTFWTHLIPLLLYNKIKGPFEGGTSHLNILQLICCLVQLELQFIPSLSYLLTLKGYFQKIDYIMFMRHNFFLKIQMALRLKQLVFRFSCPAHSFSDVFFFFFIINAALFFDGLISI